MKSERRHKHFISVHCCSSIDRKMGQITFSAISFLLFYTSMICSQSFNYKQEQEPESKYMLCKFVDKNNIDDSNGDQDTDNGDYDRGKNQNSEESESGMQGRSTNGKSWRLFWYGRMIAISKYLLL